MPSGFISKNLQINPRIWLTYISTRVIIHSQERYCIDERKEITYVIKQGF